MFDLAYQQAQQVEAHLNRLKRNGWLTFKGPEAVELLRKVLVTKAKPHLIAHCHYNLAAEPMAYEFFVPESVEVISRRDKLVRIRGKCRGHEGTELFWQPEKVVDPSGNFLSYVSTLEKGFPESTISGITLPPLEL